MTPEEMRIAIAEKCGWVEVVGCFKWKGDQKDPPKQFMRGCGHLPDYLNDLNAMHDAEKTLNPDAHHNMWCEYIKNLSAVTGVVYCINATAVQRAEAFCRTLWPERFK